MKADKTLIWLVNFHWPSFSVSRMAAFFSILLPLLLLASKSFGEVVCESGAIDIVFVVDDSGSVGSDNFQIALEAAVSLVDSLKVGTDSESSRVGFVVFDNIVRLGFYLDSFTTNAQVDAAILATVYNNGETNIADAMNYALEKVFDYDENLHGKRGVPRIMLLITDGQDSTDVTTQHTLAVQRGIITYAIGVGDGVDVTELTAVTGSSNNVFLASDFSALKNTMNKVCHTIEASVSPPVPAHNPHSCGCELETMDDARFWLDIIFVVDSSDGVSQNDFQSIKSFLMMMSQLNIDHTANDPQYTRMAIINTASTADVFLNLTSGMSGAQIQNYVNRQLTQKGGYSFDVQKGLIQAQELISQEQQMQRRENVRKAVVIFSTTAIECNEKSVRAAANESDVLCELVSRMKGEGTTLVAVALRLAGEGDPPNINIVDKCDLLENNDDLPQNLLLVLCRVNCYCLTPYTQFVIGDDGCDRYSECLFAQILALPYHSAKTTCEDQNSTLATVFSQEKDDFLRDLHLNAGFYPYWIGLTCTTDQCTLPDETQLSPGDHTNWCTSKSQPNIATGQCVYEGTCDKFDAGWFSEKCGNFYPAHYFACQTSSCSVNHYCEYTSTENKVSTRKLARTKRRREA